MPWRILEIPGALASLFAIGASHQSVGHLSDPKFRLMTHIVMNGRQVIRKLPLGGRCGQDRYQETTQKITCGLCSFVLVSSGTHAAVNVIYHHDRPHNSGSFVPDFRTDVVRLIYMFHPYTCVYAFMSPSRSLLVALKQY